jgi:two-component system KDP operon response regulator KdpE
MRIVIIEDEEDLGYLMRNFLNRTIHDDQANTIKIATSIKDGMAYIDEINPQLVFLDNNLPDGKGINCIKEIKKITSGSLLVMMSAITTIKDEALSIGADFFLDKPISFTEVSSILNNSEGKKKKY